MNRQEPMRSGQEVPVTIDLTEEQQWQRTADPLLEFSARSIRRLARRADRYRRTDVARFEATAARHGITPRKLRLLADAWAEGGRAGLDAIGPTVPMDLAFVDRATEVIESWRRRHFPLDALKVEVWRNQLTVFWMRPSADRNGDLVRHSLMQLRRTGEGRWHLYRKAAQGEWWPVVVRGHGRRQSLSACLDTVRIDQLHHFWGSAGPPDDLGRPGALPDWPVS